jgi:Nif-specific regulatory protein
VPVLVEHFLKKYNEENAKSVKITPEVLDALIDYDWPGNVRELENTVERLVVMSARKSAGLSDLPLNIRDRSLRAARAIQTKDALPAAIADIEKANILDALKKTGWVQAKAARLLGLTPRQIGYKIKRYGIVETD